jgi:hypothetical protein
VLVLAVKVGLAAGRTTAGYRCRSPRASRSILIDAAVKYRLIDSIDDSVVGYITEFTGTGYDGVTIRHLMTMSSGVRWKEDYVDLRSDVAFAGGEEMVGGVPPLVALRRTSCFAPRGIDIDPRPVTAPQDLSRPLCG